MRKANTLSDSPFLTASKKLEKSLMGKKTPSLIERTNHVYRGSDIFFRDFYFEVQVRIKKDPKKRELF